MENWSNIIKDVDRQSRLKGQRLRMCLGNSRRRLYGLEISVTVICQRKTEFVPAFAKSRNGSGREPIQPWNSSRTEGLRGSLNQAGVRMGKEQVEWLPRRLPQRMSVLHLQFSCTRVKRSTVSVPQNTSSNVANRRDGERLQGVS